MLSERYWIFVIYTLKITRKYIFYLIFFLKITLISSEKWWCTEYADEIHDVLQKREFDRCSLDFKSPQLKWRPHIIQYMLDTAQKHELAKTTFHLGKQKIKCEISLNISQ